MNKKVLHLTLLLTIALAACAPSAPAELISSSGESLPTPQAEITPLPTRPNFKPGELVDYTAQSGDTLPALAARLSKNGRALADRSAPGAVLARWDEVFTSLSAEAS